MRSPQLPALLRPAWLTALLLTCMTQAHAADGGLLYATRSPLTLKAPSKRVQLHAAAGAHSLLANRSCERVTLLLTGIRAPSVEATGVRVSIGKVQLGMFSLYGLEAGVARTLSFDVPQLPAFAAPAKTVALTVELLGHRGGAVTVDSVKIWCTSPSGPS